MAMRYTQRTVAPNHSTKFKITVEVEFSDRGLADYKSAIDINYGDPIKTKKDILEGLQRYALHGIDDHFQVMAVDPIEGSTL